MIQWVTSRLQNSSALVPGAMAKRRGELFDIDLARARDWFAEYEAPGAKRAPVLDPRDPRHRERTAAAAIKQLKLGLANGNKLRLGDVLARFENELTTLRTGLLRLNNRFSHELANVTPGDAERLISEAVEDELSVLKSDDPTTWPATAAPDGEEDDSWLATEEPETLPLLTPPDPRHAFALAAAQMREHQLAELEGNVIDLPTVLTFLTKGYAEVREEIRTVPFAVMMEIAEGPNDRELVEEVIDRIVYDTLTRVSGSDPKIAGAGATAVAAIS
jgi:hypothetical protein